MKLLQIVPAIHEFPDLAAFDAEFRLTQRDLILTNARYDARYIKPAGLPCPVIFREQFGSSEPNDRMVNAILARKQELHASVPGGIDRIIAIGGGSIMDMAKVLAVAPEGTKDVNDLYPGMAELKRQHELIAVPTTCGTGSEVTNISIVFRSALGTKHGLVGDALYPVHAVLIPQLLETLPYHVFACSAIDALIHAVESYLSPLATPLTDVFGELAMREIVRGFAVVAADRAALPSLYGQFLRAAANAGVAFGNAGCGPVHALSFALGGKYHVPHGESCYQYFMPVLRFYKAAGAADKLARLEALLAETLHAEDGLNALAELLERILPRKPMSAYGAVEADVEAFARSTIDNQQRLLGRACVPVTLDVARGIIADCL
ncbi:MAG: iron-containing alcohol dehydrogenase [Clostridia bacterium]|nr:iron-containing alcohol dehydrogenase [Clostridia bacterium]